MKKAKRPKIPDIPKKTHHTVKTRLHPGSALRIRCQHAESASLLSTAPLVGATSRRAGHTQGPPPPPQEPQPRPETSARVRPRTRGSIRLSALSRPACLEPSHRCQASMDLITRRPRGRSRLAVGAVPADARLTTDNAARQRAIHQRFARNDDEEQR